MCATQAKIVAFYLPQFHPIPENSAWWGEGFTEWHNVAKARPLYRGHIQPRLPGELGFYDLRLGATRMAQAQLAEDHGVYGFCYWHYWFGGRRLLETPIEEVLRLGEPKLPYCLGWANESWTGVWHGAPRRTLIEQTYPANDAARHYALLRSHFCDPRYIRHNGRPLLFIYKPRSLPVGYLEELRSLASADGYDGLHIVGNWSPNPSGGFRSTKTLGLDAALVTNLTGRDALSNAQWLHSALEKAKHILRLPVGPKRIDYATAIVPMLPDLSRFPFPAYHCVISNWDNTPRSGRRGLVLENSTATLFGKALEIALKGLDQRPGAWDVGRFVFLKSWNEWAEGNFVEPDQVHGREFLSAIAHAMANRGTPVR